MARGLWAALAPAPDTAQAASVIWALPQILFLFHIVTKLDIETMALGSMVAWLILRILQIILGPWRRHSRHWLVQYGAMAAYYLPTLIALYLAHALYSSTSKFERSLYTACCASLSVSAQGAVAMRRFTLGNDPLRLQSWRLLAWLFGLAWLQWRSIRLGRLGVTLSDIGEFINTVAFFVPRVVSLVFAEPAESNLDYETKQLADYMMDRRRRQLPFFDATANSLYDGCKYPFIMMRPRGTSNYYWIDFSDALQRRGWLLRDCTAADHGDQADICLAYTFSRLLARRYFGFPCAEEGSPQVREFVLTELLSDCSRAFAIVEVQLAFLHDYFFTGYNSNISSGFVSVKKWLHKLLFRNAWLVIVVPCLVASETPLNPVVTTIITDLPTPILPKHWHPIQNAFVYFSNPSGPPASGPRSQRQRSRGPHYWRHKLSQYCVMEDYDHRSSKETAIAWFKVHMLSQETYSFIKHHPAEGEEIGVPDSVKTLVARTLRDMNGPPTMGTRSSLGHFSWTYSEETLTHTILIWHIATWYCDKLPLSQSLPVEAKTDHEVATVLSGYCAYLVAFLPNLLPGHILTAKVVLQQVLQEIKDKLGTTRMSKEEKMTEIQTLQLPQDEFSLTTFEKGVQLGRQLEQQPDVSLRWKAMADFWAEMILYLAASDNNAAAHVEQLAQGGEFITHLWAMLSNAGILNKGTEQWTPLQQPNKATVSREEHDAPAPQPEEKSATAFYRKTKSAKT